MTLDINQTILTSTLPAFVELYEIDCTNIPEINTVYYLTPMTSSNAKVFFGGTAYDPFPIAIDGLEQSAEGAPARPMIAVANINKLFGSLSFLYEDLIGCKVTYIRTFEIYLGTAERISAPPLKFTIAKKVSHNSQGVSWEVRSPLDKERAYLPGRQMLKKDFPGLGINKRIR